jgi:plastocyanin
VRRAVPFAILTGCLGVGVLPALAADQAVSIHDYSFTPSRVAVLPGETVTWAGHGTFAMHNVHFDGEIAPVAAPSHDFSGSRTFPTEGEFKYHCDVHPDLMHGTVFVNSTGTVPAPTPSPSPYPTTSPTPSPSTSPTPGGGSPSPPPTSGGGSGATVSSFKARAARSHFCTSRSASCKKPGVFLLIDLDASRSVRLRGTLRRGAKRVRAVSVHVRPGKRRVRLPGARLKPGRYALTLRAGGITRHVRFRVRPS